MSVKQVPWSPPVSVYDGDAMPVCLAGDRLQFTVRTALTIRHGGTWITREEPEGASWDGATIPRGLWSIAGHPLEQRWRWASYWHDRLCESATCVEDRTIADAVFLRLLRSAGIVRWRRLAMWAAVRFYGLILWRAKRGEHS